MSFRFQIELEESEDVLETKTLESKAQRRAAGIESFELW